MSRLTHTVIVLNPHSDDLAIVERHYCGVYENVAITTYRAMCEAYAREIREDDWSVHIACNRFNDVENVSFNIPAEV